MARERYLIGVDTEKLREEHVPERPLTFWEKVEKFWYNYHWGVIIIGAVIALAVTVGILIGTREKVDYSMVVVTKGRLSQTVLDDLAYALEECGEDLDGNGEVKVRIIPVVMTDQGDVIELATLFSAGSEMMFAMEPTYYESQIDERETEGEYYFTTLKGDHAGLAAHKRYWNWKNTPFPLCHEKLTPSEMYFGVRAPIGTAIGREEKSAECVALLEAFMQNNPVEDPTTITVEGQ